MRICGANERRFRAEIGSIVASVDVRNLSTVIVNLACEGGLYLNSVYKILRFA